MRLRRARVAGGAVRCYVEWVMKRCVWTLSRLMPAVQLLCRFHGSIRVNGIGGAVRYRDRDDASPGGLRRSLQPGLLLLSQTTLCLDLLLSELRPNRNRPSRKLGAVMNKSKIWVSEWNVDV